MDSIQRSKTGDVCVLEDDVASREELRTILESAGYGVSFFIDKIGLLDAAQRRAPTCIFLELGLMNEPSSDFTEFRAPVFVTSRQPTIPNAVRAIRAGAIDFVPKPFSSQSVIHCIENALGLHHVRALEDAKPSTLNFPGKDILSRREMEVLDQLAAGLSSKEIGIVLGITWRTVDDHRASLKKNGSTEFDRIAVRNRQ